MTFHQFRRRVRCIRRAGTDLMIDVMLDPELDEPFVALHMIASQEGRLEKMAARLFERSRRKR